MPVALRKGGSVCGATFGVFDPGRPRATRPPADPPADAYALGGGGTLRPPRRIGMARPRPPVVPLPHTLTQRPQAYMGCSARPPRGPSARGGASVHVVGVRLGFDCHPPPPKKMFNSSERPGAQSHTFIANQCSAVNNTQKHFGTATPGYLTAKGFTGGAGLMGRNKKKATQLSEFRFDINTEIQKSPGPRTLGSICV